MRKGDVFVNNKLYFAVAKKFMPKTAVIILSFYMKDCDERNGYANEAIWLHYSSL